MKPISPRSGNENFQDNLAFRSNFSWENISEKFSWSETGNVNIAYEAVDRHAENPAKKDKPAFIYTSPTKEEVYTFEHVSKESNRLANVLRKYGVTKGEPVFLFMPRIPEFYFSFFGIIKAGAVVGPLHPSFMEQAVRDRLEDSEARVLVTTAELLERVPLMELPRLEKVIVLGEHLSDDPLFISYEKEMKAASDVFSMQWVDLEDGMLLHYIPSATDKPKGVYHAHQAMIQQYATAEWVLDIKQDDIYWSTTNPSWVSGTSYGIFAPLLHGVTSLIYAGERTPESYYEALEKYKVSIWYTNPNVLRMLASVGINTVKDYDLGSLRHLVSGGEQLHPEVITWGLKAFNLRIHDTWMMAETGTHLIANFPCNEIRPGSMGKTIPGIEAAIIDHEGKKLPPNQMGNLAIKTGWPSMMQSIWNNRGDYESYFMNDWFITGDRAYQDEDGYFWFQGRLNDVIHTAGERVGPFEIESQLIQHPAVSEAGVIGKPDPVKGEVIKAYLTLHEGYEPTEELKEDIQRFIKNSLSIHAVPDDIEIREEIPKTPSGKIMRHRMKLWEQEVTTKNSSS